MKVESGTASLLFRSLSPHHSALVDQTGVAVSYSFPRSSVDLLSEMRIDSARSSGLLCNAPNEPLVVGQQGKHIDDDLQKLDERHFSGRLTLLIITFRNISKNVDMAEVEAGRQHKRS